MSYSEFRLGKKVGYEHEHQGRSGRTTLCSWLGYAVGGDSSIEPSVCDVAAERVLAKNKTGETVRSSQRNFLTRRGGRLFRVT